MKSIPTHSAGRRVKLYGASAIFIGMIMFFCIVAATNPNSFLIGLSVFLFIGGFVTFIIGRFMD